MFQDAALYLKEGKLINMKKFILTILLALIIPIAAFAQAEEDVNIERADIEVEDIEAMDIEEPGIKAEDSIIAGSGGADDAPDASPGGGMAGMLGSFLGESFQADLATGAATMGVPISVPPGRKKLQPSIGLSYSSNNSNGICGVGWAIPVNLIQRSTKKGVPTYDDEADTFSFISSGANAELVNIGGNEYRAEHESAFMKYIYSSDAWLVYDKVGTKYQYGHSSLSRLEQGNNIFAWYLDRVEDVYGNYLTYIYEELEDGQIYLKSIEYTGGIGLNPDKKIIFIYEDRPDKSNSYRSGWKITTTQRLSAIHITLKNVTVWHYKLSYIASEDTGRSLLERVTVSDKDGNTLPSKTFKYQRLD